MGSINTQSFYLNWLFWYDIAKQYLGTHGLRFLSFQRKNNKLLIPTVNIVNGALIMWMNISCLHRGLLLHEYIYIYAWCLAICLLFCFSHFVCVWSYYTWWLVIVSKLLHFKSLRSSFYLDYWGIWRLKRIKRWSHGVELDPRKGLRCSHHYMWIA